VKIAGVIRVADNDVDELGEDVDELEGQAP
jgi:hypothetical protein